MSIYQEKMEEVKTIRKRKIELNLSDADVKRLAEKAGLCDMTVGQLLENFIGDLVDGTYSNGSDECDLAEQWFERCGSTFSKMNFLYYLIDYGKIDEVLEAWEEVIESERTIDEINEQLETGKIHHHESTYTWQDIVWSETGKPVYSTYEEWEAEQRDEIAKEEETIELYRKDITCFWNNYIECTHADRSFDEEMEHILKWKDDYQLLLDNELNSREVVKKSLMSPGDTKINFKWRTKEGNYIYIKENIKQLMNFYDLGINELARLTHINPGTLSNNVNGRYQEDKLLLRTLINLCSCFRMTLDELVFEELKEGSNLGCCRVLKNRKTYVRANLICLVDQKGISFGKLAKATSVSNTSLLNLRNEHTSEKNMEIGTIIKLANYFNLTLEEMVFEDQREKRVEELDQLLKLLDVTE